MGSSSETENDRPASLLASNRPTVTVVLAVPTGPVGAYGGTGVGLGVGVGGFAVGVLRRCLAIHHESMLLVAAVCTWPCRPSRRAGTRSPADPGRNRSLGACGGRVRPGVSAERGRGCDCNQHDDGNQNDEPFHRGDALPIGQMDLIPDQVQPVSTRTAESTNSASDSTPLSVQIATNSSGQDAEKQHKRRCGGSRTTQEVGAAESRARQCPHARRGPRRGLASAGTRLKADGDRVERDPRRAARAR